MLRTSYSQILNSSRDFSIALCDAQCRLVAQADHIPVHVGAMPWAARAVAEAFPRCARGRHLPAERPLPRRQPPARPHHPRAGLRRGGAPLLVGGARAPERHRRRHAWRLQPGRHRDLAGRPPRPADPPRRGRRAARGPAADAGGQHPHSARLPWRPDGDGRRRAARREAAAAAAGEARRREAGRRGRRHPRPLGSACAAHRRGLAGRRPGRARPCSTTTASAATDIADPRHASPSGATRSTVDLSESDAQATGFVNSSFPNMRSAVRMAFAFLLDPEVAKNDGAFRPLEVVAREGTVVWAREGAPVTHVHLATAPTRSWKRSSAPCSIAARTAPWAAGAGASASRSRASDTRRPGRGFVWHLFHARPGGGGSAGGDGWSTRGEWHSAGGLKFGSVEMAEARFPLLFERHEFLPRLRRRRPAPRRPRRRAGAADRERRPLPRQHRRRRRPARRRRHARRRRTARRTTTGSAAPTARSASCAPRKSASRSSPATALLVRSGGGGGWGDPARRDPAARERDRAGGLRVSGSTRGRVPHRRRCRRHLHRRGRHRRRRHRDARQGRQHAARPERRRARRPGEPRRRARPAAGASCWRGPSASSTAPPSPPTRCWSAGRARRACSPPRAIAT